MSIIMQTVIAAFAVLGVYFFVKVLFGRFFPIEHITRTVIVDRKETLKSLDIILEDARRSELCSYKNAVVVEVKEELFSSATEEERAFLYEAAEKSGARVKFF